MMPFSTGLLLRIALLLMAISGTALPAWSEEVGTVAAVEGNVRIGRAGTWTDATPGASIAVGDQLSTGQPGRMRVVFRDDSVLVLSENTNLVIDAQVFDPSASESVFSLLQGTLRSVVSHYYGTAGSSYEVHTATAVAGVRGTEFVMTYDPESGASEVVGIRGVVTVHSAVDPTGPGLLVTANQVTAVAPGALPSPAEPAAPELMRRLLRDDFFGMSDRTSVIGASAVMAGASVPQPARAPAGTGGRALAFAPEGPSFGVDASTALGNSPAAIISRGRGSIIVDPGRP